MANKGDTLPILINYKIDGTPIEEANLDEIEFTLGNAHYTLTDNDISLDAETGKYCLCLSQETTLELNNISPFHIRFKKGTAVASTDIDFIIIGDSLSTEVL